MYARRVFEVLLAWLLLSSLALAQGEAPSAPLREDGNREQQVRLDSHGDPLPTGAFRRLGTTHFRPGGIVRSISFPPGGKTLLTSSCDLQTPPRIALWDRQTGKLLREFPPIPLSQGVDAGFALSADAKIMATARNEKCVHLWDVASAKELRRLEGHKKDVDVALAFSANGKVLAVAEVDGTIRLWDAATAREMHVLEGHSKRITGLAFSADGKLLASASRDDTLRLWDATSGRQIHQLPADLAVRPAVAFSPDGKLLTCGLWTGVIPLWDVASGEVVRRLRTPRKNAVEELAFSPDGKLLAFASSPSTFGPEPVCLLEVATGKEVRRFPSSTLWVRGMAFADRGKVLACGSHDGMVCFWDVATGAEIANVGGHTGFINSIAFAPDGKTLCSASDDTTARLWDAATGQEIRVFRGHDHQRRKVAFSADGKTLVTGADSDAIRIWNVATGKELRPLKTGPRPPMMDVGLSPDGKTVAIASYDDGGITLWDVATGEGRLRLREDRVFDVVAFSLEGTMLAAAHFSGSIAIWDLTTTRKLAFEAGPEKRNSTVGFFVAIAFSPDGRMLAMSQPDGAVCLWELATGRQRLRIGAGEKNKGNIVFSPDGRTLVTTSFPGGARFWDTITGKEIGRRMSHRGPTLTLAMSPDGRTLASAGMDTAALLWDVVELTGRPSPAATLSAKEWEAQYAELADNDSALAYQALGRMAADPVRTTAALKDRLRAVQEADPKRLDELLADLDSPRLAVRDRAMAEVLKLGDAARPAQARTLKKPELTLEYRRRVEQALDRLAVLSGERLQGLRAVEVLEHIGTTEAQQVLEALARGIPEARLTQEARAAMRRLDRRKS